VDDEPDLLEGLKSIFSSESYEVDCFSSAEETIEKIKKQASYPWDLVISDINMPGQSGLSLCRQVRAIKKDQYLPFILITGSGGEDQKLEGIRAGADDFFEKPFKPEVILEKTRYLLELKQSYQKALQRTIEIRERNTLLSGRIQELARFLPPKIAGLLQSGHSSEILKKHRSEISVCFIDLRRFTEFSETAEPEDVLHVLENYYRVIGGCIDQFEATLGHISGDGMMIFMNDPEKKEDHQLHLAKMAVEIRNNMNELKKSWDSREFNLDFGLGLADGYATIGAVGIDRYWQYTVIGTVVNLSSRLCQLADQGQILCSHRFLSKLHSVFEARPLQQHNFKGIQRSVQVHELRLNSKKLKKLS
jgi:class 3 adenylate cyclase